MARAIRVLLKPSPPPRAADSSQANLVRGASVSFVQHGAGKSGATSAPQPAKLLFHVLMFKRIRGAAAEKTLLVASIEGTLVLRGQSRTPVFINGLDESGLPNTLQYESPALSDRDDEP